MTENSRHIHKEVPEFVAPMASSGKRLKGMQGGVEIPTEDRAWAQRVGSDFKRLDYTTQLAILNIIAEIQKLNPQEAKNAGKILEEYFRGVSNARDPKGLTDALAEALEKERKKNLH